MKKAENGKDGSKNQRIQVFARCRPLNSMEKRQFSPIVVDANSERKEVKVRDEKMINKTFVFDKVFGPDTKQISVYKAVVGPLMQDVLMGYNCTVFAYGQTGTGKTFTMEGERSNGSCSWEEDPNAGIIPRSLHQLFEELTKEEIVEFSAHVSFLELYNEELFDLLSQNDVSKLRLFEDSARKGSVVIQGLEEIKVNSKDEVYAILEQGTARRQKASTLLNATSSRSHTVFSVTIHIKENTIDGEELLKTGKLNLVDLAGSENIGRSGASQKTAREAGNINQSLLTLGRVITALVEKAPHIPYRESKLTRLLQDSLGGHTKTSIIATISPAHCNIEETISTLDYAQRAKNITIKPEVNQKMTKKALIKEYTEEIERLRKDLVAMRDQSGFYIDMENYNLMQQKILTKSNEITELENKIEAMTVELEKVQQLFTDTSEKLYQTTNSLNTATKMYEETSEKLSTTKRRLKHTKQVLNHTEIDRDKKQCVNKIKHGMEKELHFQAKMILQAAEESGSHVDALHTKIERTKNIDNTNKESTSMFRMDLHKEFAKMDDSMKYLAHYQDSSLKTVSADIDHTSGALKSMSAFTFAGLDEFFLLQSEFMRCDSEFCSNLLNNHITWGDDVSKELMDQMTHFMQLKHNVMENALSNLKDSFHSKIKDVNEQVQTLRDGISSRITESERVSKTMQATYLTSLAKVKDMFDSFHAQKTEKLENYGHWTREMMTEVDNMKKQQMEEVALLTKTLNDRISDHHLKLSKKISQHQTDIVTDSAENESAVTNINRELKELGEPIDASFAHSVSSYSELNSYQIENIEKVQKTVGELECTQNELQKEIQTFVENVSINEEKNQVFIESIKEEQKKTVSQLKQQEDAAEAVMSRLGSLKQQKFEEIEKQDKQSAVSIQNLKDFVVQIRETLNQGISSVRKALLKRDNDVERYVSEVLIQDIPTGKTPKRKTFNYPRKLNDVISPGKILEDIEQRVYTDQEIAVNQEFSSSFDETLDGNIDEVSNGVCHSVQQAAADIESDCSVSSQNCDENNRNKENQPTGSLTSSIPRRVHKKVKAAKQFLKPQGFAPNRKQPLHSSSENLRSTET